MSRNLIRISLNRTDNSFYLEYGLSSIPGLTVNQKEEKTKLEEELMGYQDFAVAEDLEGEKRQELMNKKKRLEELKKMEIEPHIEWIPVPLEDVSSVFLLVQPSQRSIYVENLPDEFVIKIIGPTPITINVSGGTPPGRVGDGSFPVPLETPLSKAIRIVGSSIDATGSTAKSAPNWKELIEIKDTNGLIIVKPKGFLGDIWTPINEAIKKAYGDIWKSKGKGDKEAHWEIPK